MPMGLSLKMGIIQQAESRVEIVQQNKADLPKGDP